MHSAQHTPILEQTFTEGYRAGVEASKESMSQVSQCSYDDGFEDGYDKALDDHHSKSGTWKDLFGGFLVGAAIGQIVVWLAPLFA